MSDLMARFPAGSAVLAVRFPTTARVVRSLGGPRLPSGFAVVVDAGRLGLVGLRKQTSLWELPVSSVLAVSVAETRSSPPYPQVSLAIVLRVRTGAGFTELPIVPVSDDGKRSLTWRDADVRALAMRLSDAMKIAPDVG
ncbi:hypothetical protein [Leifsonia shinshuensis]